MEKKLDLYTDYLLTTVHQATATGLARVVDGAVSHDKFTRLLAENEFSSKDLWLAVKPSVRRHQSDSACMIFDDSLIEKPYTDENDLVCWHYDHCTRKMVKGVNLLTAFYHSQASDQELPLRIPIGFRLILKPLHSCNIKTKKVRRKSPLTKNEMLRQMVQQGIHNQLKFKYVLADTWFGSSENMLFIHRKKKFFIFDMKSNRQTVKTEKDRNKGQWTRIDELDIPDNTPVKVWLKDLEIPVFLFKQVFKNKDQSTGVRFLVSNDSSLSGDDFATLYKKRWSIEEYHKSLKQNAAIAKSPTRTVRTQSNHLFASILAYVKLEKLKFIHQLNHFALKSKIYIAANKAAFEELKALRAMQPCA